MPFEMSGSDSAGRVDKKPAPIRILSPAKKLALIECLNSNLLHKDKGFWRGLSDKVISGGTIADLCREGMLAVTINRKAFSAQLTERGAWFARTLVDLPSAEI
jgi:hypothetical protein